MNSSDEKTKFYQSNDLFQSFHPSLQEVLLSSLGWFSLRPVQEETYRAVKNGADVIVIAPTAGGKTESAFIPVIDYLLKNAQFGIGAVYISPLKALINDQEDRIKTMCERAGLIVASQHGDVATRDRWKFTEDGDMPNILLITPESLESLLDDPISRASFSHIQFVIIDEIHAFMETERGVHLRCLLDRLEKISESNKKHNIQRIGLSATVGNPEDLLLWLSDTNRLKQLVKIPSPPSTKQFSFIVEEDFYSQVHSVAKSVLGKKALVFVDSRSFAEKLMKPLTDEVPNVFLHHSSISSEGRAEAENAFLGACGACIICTSTMELGIDIGDLDLVVQYGTPKSVASFLQRLGRTGRRGKPATMLFVLNTPCDLLISVAVIESAMRHEIEPLKAPHVAWNVLIQQLFLLLKNNGAMGKYAIISSIKSLSPFSDVSDETITNILQYLTEQKYLYLNGDLYLIGIKAEHELGRSNWISLISVINDTGGYLAVLPDGTVVGTLDPRFVAGEPGKIFTFTGKNWKLLFRDDMHKRVLVEPNTAIKGDFKRPFWSSGSLNLANDITPLVCQSVANIINRGKTILPLPESQIDILSDLLQSLPADIQVNHIHIRTEPEVKGWSVIISTFLGIKANMILTRLIQNNLGTGHIYRYTPFAIRITDFDSQNAEDIIHKILDDITTLDIETVEAELPEIPASYWKFGTLLPNDLIHDMTVNRYYSLQELLKSLSTLNK